MQKKKLSLKYKENIEYIMQEYVNVSCSNVAQHI